MTPEMYAAEAWLKELDDSDSGEILLNAADEIERDPKKVAGILRTLARHVQLDNKREDQ